ncbi:hypothetical protein F5141DRAFT_1063693 [Pisolithus sp. B1]|nr:hypothetical protein F5141DRAFT_1063693 [Pisolithus sp. B1]
MKVRVMEMIQSNSESIGMTGCDMEEGKQGVAVVKDEGRSSDGSSTLSMAGKKVGCERSAHCTLGNEVLELVLPQFSLAWFGSVVTTLVYYLVGLANQAGFETMAAAWLSFETSSSWTSLAQVHMITGIDNIQGAVFCAHNALTNEDFTVKLSPANDTASVLHHKYEILWKKALTAQWSSNAWDLPWMSQQLTSALQSSTGIPTCTLIMILESAVASLAAMLLPLSTVNSDLNQEGYPSVDSNAIVDMKKDILQCDDIPQALKTMLSYSQSLSFTQRLD